MQLVLEESELSPRELAVRFTDTESYFVSEASVFRLLKALVVGGVEPVQREMLLDRRRAFRRDIGRQQDLCRNWTLLPSCHAECQKTVYRMN